MSNIKTDSPTGQTDREYLEFDLEPETMATVEQMASEAGVSPFEMCVILLRERLATELGGLTEPKAKPAA
jgi:hypothetical protein